MLACHGVLSRRLVTAKLLCEAGSFFAKPEASLRSRKLLSEAGGVYVEPEML